MDPEVASPTERAWGAALGPVDAEGDWQRLKKWRKSSTDGCMLINISHACTKSARVTMVLGPRCTMWMAYASSTSMK
jgi:hypothetical protein